MQDQEYIIRQAGLEEILTPIRTFHQNRAAGRARTKTLLGRYYSQLNLSLLNELIEMYKIDYDMFGYNATKYYDYVPH